MYANKISTQAWGMAIFYRRNRFTLLETRRLDLTRLWEGYEDVRNLISCDPALEEQMRRTSTVAQVMLLQPFDRHGITAQRLVVVNVHLYSHPSGGHIRILQAALLLREVERLHPGMPLVFCGDFNADRNGGVHEFLAQGRLSARHFDWQEGYAALAVTRSASKAEREEFWFSVLKLEDMYSLRRLFVHLCALSKGDDSGRDVAGAVFARHWAQVKAELPDLHGEAVQLLDELAAENGMDGQGGSVAAPPPNITYLQLFQQLAKVKAAMLRDGTQAGRDAYKVFLERFCLAQQGDGEVGAWRNLPRELPPRASLVQRRGVRDTAANGNDTTSVGLDVRHDFELSEALPDVQVTYCGGIPPEPGAVDYMFFSRCLLRALPPFAEFTATDVAGGLPSSLLPSDHVSLLADFEWIGGICLEQNEEREQKEKKPKSERDKAQSTKQQQQQNKTNGAGSNGQVS